MSDSEGLPVLDILVLFLVGRHIAAITKRKNRNPVGYVLLLVFAYIGFGLTFGITAVIVAGVDMDQGNDNDFLLAFMAGALIGYAVGVGLAYTVACAVPPLPKRRYREDGYDDYDDYDAAGPPIRRRDADPYDYEDEPRARRRRRDEDDDYDRPRRRRDED